MFLFILSDVSLRESEKLYNSFKLPLVSCRGDNMYMCSILLCNFSRPVSHLHPVFTRVMQATMLLDGLVRSVRTNIYACTCHPPYGEL